MLSTASLLVMTALALAAPVETTAELRTVDGRTASGVVSTLDEKSIVLTVDGHEQKFATADVLSLTFTGDITSRASKPTVWVELTDGSTLSGSDFRLNKAGGALTVGERETLALPAASLRAVRFGESPQGGQQWAENLQGKATADLIAVRKKETIDFLEGVIGGVDADAVQFQLDGDNVPVKRARVEGLIFFRRPAELPAASAVIETYDGWRIHASKVILARDKLAILTPAGVLVQQALSQVAKVDYSAEKLTYLGDLKPESYEWNSFFDFSKTCPALAQFYRPRQNQAQSGGPLRLGGKPYAKGLQLFSKTTINFRVPDKAQRFQATVGIDDAVRDVGNVRLQVFGDSKQLFDGPIAGSDAPKPLDLPLDGVRRLKIVVDFGEDQDIGDHLDLCEARFVK